MLSSNHHRQDTTAPATLAHDATALSVLLVDDESTLRSALRRYFTRRGWTVCEAVDGEQARAILLDGAGGLTQFDVVITDVRMPRLSGMELHQLVAQVNPRLSQRFVFSSGDAGDEDAIAYLAKSNCPVVQKPFELASLLAIVERIAARSASAPTR